MVFEAYLRNKQAWSQWLGSKDRDLEEHDDAPATQPLLVAEP